MVKHLSGPPNLDPILNISASAHALVENSPLTYLAPLQLAVLSSLSPENVMQVAASGIEPGLSIGLQQEISNQQRGLPPTLLSAEVSLLTMPTKTFAISHAYKFSNMQHPLYLSASATNMLESISTPHVEIEIHQPLPRAQGGGAFWLTMNSGDWGYAVGYPRLCTLFHRLCYIAKERSQPPWGVFTGGFSDILSLVIAMPPQFEVGWTGCKKWTAGARPAVPCRRISTGVYSGCFSHKSRYQATASIGGLVGFGISARYRTGITSHAFQRIRYSRRVGLELELKTSSLMGPQVVGRALARLGKFSHVGLELGSGARGTLYLGFHWQRLGQRISLPVLIAAGEGCGIIAQIAFWGSIAPVIVSAAVNTFKKWRLARMDEIEGKEARKSVREQKKMKEERERIINEEAVEREQERRRIEADILSALLAPGTEARQARERKEEGLVIHSAKFGLRNDKTGEWDSGEELADVTVALAALVGENGEIVIPKNTKMERLLGFWDPCPGKRKTLLVRYSDGGKESEVVVKSGEKLVLGL